MKLVPNSASRLAARNMLKLRSASPTLLVVGGVVGLGVTAVMAARATRKIDPVLEDHRFARDRVGEDDRGRNLIKIYSRTGMGLAKVYGPTIVIGVTSAACVLGGHKVLRGRHIATMAAYSGLSEQFIAYRGRVAKTLGEGLEREIYNGATGEYVEDPDHKGEYKLQAKPGDDPESYLRPWFDESNVHYTVDPITNYLTLKAVQQQMNNRLQVHGHVFLNDVLDALHMPRTREGAVLGWLYKDGNNQSGDDYIDLGFLSSQEPQAVAFRNHETGIVQLNFNVDDVLIWDQI